MVETLNRCRAGGRAARIPRPGAGAHVSSGAHARYEKNFYLKKIYSKYKMNKHVESLPKIDKFIISLMYSNL